MSTGSSIELSHVLPQGYEWRKAPEGQLQLWRVDVSPEVLLTEQDIALLDVNGSIRAAVNTLYLEKAHAIKSSGEEIAFKNLETGVNYMPAWAASTPGGVDILPLGGIVEGELITNFEPGGTLLATGSVSAAFTSVITSNSTFYGTSYVCAEAYEGVLHLSVRDSRNEEVFHFDLPYASYSAGQVVSIEDIFYRVRVGNTRTIGVYKSNGDPLMVRPCSLDNTKPYRKYSVRSFSDRRVILAGGDGKIPLGDLPDLNTSEAKVVNTEAERLALPEVDKLYIVTQITAGPNSAAGYQWFLNPNTDPSISNNWVRGANTGNSVLTFAGRSGPVEPQAGDYTSEQVGAVGLPGADGVRRVLIGNIPTQETIADDLVTNSSTSVLSARMGKQLQDSKQSTITGAASTVTTNNLSTSRALVSDSSGKIAASSSVTALELSYLDGASSNIQTQLDNKQATVTGAGSTLTSSDLTTNRVLVSDSLGKVGVSGTSSEKLAHLNGVTSDIQTQINNKADKAHAKFGYDLVVSSQPKAVYRGVMLTSGVAAAAINVNNVPWVYADINAAEQSLPYWIQQITTFFKNLENDNQFDQLIGAVPANFSIPQGSWGVAPSGSTDMDNGMGSTTTYPSESFELIVGRNVAKTEVYTFGFTFSQFANGTYDTTCLNPFRIIYQTTRGASSGFSGQTIGGISTSTPRCTARGTSFTVSSYLSTAFPLMFEPVCFEIDK